MASGIDFRMVLPDPLKSYGTISAEDLRKYLQALVEALSADHDDVARAINEIVESVNPVAAQAYTPTNVTTDRSFDANATTVDELADVLGTLIADLQARGLL